MHTKRIQISELGFNSILIKIRYEWQTLLFLFLLPSLSLTVLCSKRHKNALTHTVSHNDTCSRLINGMLDALLIQNVPFPFFPILSFYFIPFLCLHAYKSNVNMNVYACVRGVCIGICLYELNFLLNFRKAVNSCVCFVVVVDVDVISKMIDHNTQVPARDTQKWEGEFCVQPKIPSASPHQMVFDWVCVYAYAYVEGVGAPMVANDSIVWPLIDKPLTIHSFCARSPV